MILLTAAGACSSREGGDGGDVSLDLVDAGGDGGLGYFDSTEGSTFGIWGGSCSLEVLLLFVPIGFLSFDNPGIGNFIILVDDGAFTGVEGGIEFDEVRLFDTVKLSDIISLVSSFNISKAWAFRA